MLFARDVLADEDREVVAIGLCFRTLPACHFSSLDPPRLPRTLIGVLPESMAYQWRHRIGTAYLMLVSDTCSRIAESSNLC